MEAIEELTELSEAMKQASAVLADEDVDDKSTYSKRSSTFLNVVALGNVVSFSCLFLSPLVDKCVGMGVRYRINVMCLEFWTCEVDLWILCVLNCG